MKMKHIKSDVAPVSGQHTPTPWHLPSNKLTGLSENIVWNQAGQLIAACDSNVHIDAETKKANAEFIVRACNCHDELVRALQAVVEYWDKSERQSYEAAMENVCHLATQARAALNKASR